VTPILFTPLIVEAALSAVLAPLAGVATWLPRRVAFACGAACAVIVISLATAIGATTADVRSLAAAQLTVTVGALALAGVGAACAALLRDVLDAAACAVSIGLVATFGILAAGPRVGDLPTPLVNAALLASPVVASASAANVDILRGDILYQLSPIAHPRFEYPSWYGASALFTGVAAAGFTLAAARTRRVVDRRIDLLKRTS
jgi:hypothetical protein